MRDDGFHVYPPRATQIFLAEPSDPSGTQVLLKIVGIIQALVGRGTRPFLDRVSPQGQKVFRARRVVPEQYVAGADQLPRIVAVDRNGEPIKLVIARHGLVSVGT